MGSNLSPGLFNQKGGGSFTILQDTPALSQDLKGIYALSYVLPPNSLGNESGILVILSNAEYSFAKSAAPYAFGVALYNGGDTYAAVNLPSFHGTNAAFDAETYCTAAAYLDSSGNLIFLENCSQFNSVSTPYQDGGPYDSTVTGPPNVSGTLDWTQPITVQLVFTNLATAPPVQNPQYLSGYSRLILVT